MTFAATFKGTESDTTAMRPKAYWNVHVPLSLYKNVPKTVTGINTEWA